jgi:formate hydrogenlyase subunit 6/NADH:ubiquinone oxidoreductase subunit I
MQLQWLVRGLRTGIVTTRYPAEPEPQPEAWRGRPTLDPNACRAADGCAACVAVCLPGALRSGVESTGAERPYLMLDYGRCIMCGLCVPACPAGALRMQPDYEVATRAAEDLRVTVRWEAKRRETNG